MIDVFSTYRSYFVAATLGAHSNFSQEGFRQKDVRFLLSLFLNWMDSTTKGVDEQIHHTQISRYLEGLVKTGFCIKLGRGRQTRYQLTRIGLLDLVSQLVQGPIHAPIEQFFFIFYFVRTYGLRLNELVAQKENRLPRSFQVELEVLLSAPELLERQIRYVQLEIRKLELRMQDTQGAAALASQLVAKGTSNDETVKAVEQLFPYELNSHKSMSDLFREVPATMRMWELTTGNENRAGILWSGMKQYLESYFQILQGLKARLSLPAG